MQVGKMYNFTSMLNKHTVGTFWVQDTAVSCLMTLFGNYISCLVCIQILQMIAFEFILWKTRVLQISKHHFINIVNKASYDISICAFLDLIHDRKTIRRENINTTPKMNNATWYMSEQLSTWLVLALLLVFDWLISVFFILDTVCDVSCESIYLLKRKHVNTEYIVLNL